MERERTFFLRRRRGREALGVLLLPVPQVLTHGLEVSCGHPAELLLGLGGVRIHSSNIASAAPDNLVGDRLPRHLVDSLDHLEHRVSAPQPKVVHFAAWLIDFPTDQ